MLEAVADLWPIFLGALAFLFGKMFGQSEKVLDQKRRAYERFLEICPAPNEAHSDEQFDGVKMQRSIGVLTLYGSKDALENAGSYFTAFGNAQPILENVTEAGHPEFFKLMTAYNRMVWSMRVDAMTWSAFAPTKENREYKPSIPQEDLK